MKAIIKSMVLLSGLALAGMAVAYEGHLVEHLRDMYTGADVGTVTVTVSPAGLVFTPDLHGLPPGTYAFHVHENPSCDNHGMAAGGHLDPMHTGKHLGPNGHGHLGDLPTLIVNADGTDTTPVVAPNLKSLNQIQGHSLMIHAGGDNYSDTPKANGGGGDRMYCAVIQ